MLSQIKDLHIFSSGLKIGISILWFFALVILPNIYPGIIELEYPVSIRVSVILVLATNIFFEVLKSLNKKDAKNIQIINNIQLLTGTLLLSWFLHVFGRINGPFFILYFLMIMESSLNLNSFFPNIITAIASFFTLSEYVYLGYTGEIVFGLGSFLEVFIRILSLTIMRNYGISLAGKLVDDQKTKIQVQDYTKNLENLTEELETTNEKLRLSDKQKDEFISMAAHELRAPMTAIKGYVSMVLEGDTGDIPEKARGFLADANNINDRLIRLVNNMLNVSRIEEGRMLYQLEEENLSRPVRSVFSQFAPEAERKGLEYKLEIPAHIKDKVKVDPDRIQEVIGNLLSNAVKYTDKGSIKVILGQKGRAFVRCEVLDTGCGISKEEQNKLFQKFHRVETNVGKTTGTGLGLYISKLLVEKFGGKMGVDSKPGKGSTFWFDLPLSS